MNHCTCLVVGALCMFKWLPCFALLRRKSGNACCNHFFLQKNYQAFGPPNAPSIGPLPWPATSEADSWKAAQPQATSLPKTTAGWPTPRSRPQRAPTPRSRPRPQPPKLLPHNGDKTGCGHRAAHYPRSPRRAWLQKAVRDSRFPCGSAL